MGRTRKKGDYNNYYGNTEVPVITYSKCNYSDIPPPIGCLELLYLLADDRREAVIARESYLRCKTKKSDRDKKIRQIEDIEASYTKLVKAKLERL
jgi:hypothetical protein